MNTLLALTLLLGANALQDAWDQATRAYDTGNYAAAAQSYEQLIASSVNDPNVFYNLGNTYYRLGHLGAAVANYERALQLDPGMERARENLDQALRQTKRNLARPLAPEWEQGLLFWHHGMHPGTVWWLGVFSWTACWALLALYLWRRPRFVRAVAACFAVLALLFAYSSWVKAHPLPLAVAVSATVPVRFGMNESETVRFELYEGDRVLVDDAQNGWFRVITVSGERGWAKASDFLRVGPPYAAFEAPAAAGPDA